MRRQMLRPLMYPYVCGQCCCSPCCGCQQVDAIDHYTSREKKYKEKCEEEKATAYQDPLGIAFVTFLSDAMTERVRADFRLTCKGAHNPQPSSVYRDLRVDGWRVRYAPSPENIYWENLAESGWKWWTKTILVNISVMILLFFFTTPLIIINNLNEIQLLKPMEEHSPVLVQFLPTLLLWTFSAVMPNIVYYTDQYVGHWTRTSEHHNVMVKTFIFLLLMVLILPSLGLTSASALFQWFVLDKEKSFRWRCIFLTGNGAFFVNYVITAAFIGSALELIRFSELLVYVIKLSLSQSTAEKTSVRKAVVWEFQFGTQYAWMLCVFAVIMAYSIPCPLVAPFGLVYMVLKHLVDRYNIYFAYKPSKINKQIHNTAINFVVVAVLLLQFNVVFFTALRAEGFSPVFVFSAVALFITLVIFVGRGFFGWFKNLSPLKYRQFGERDGFVSPPGEPNIQPFVASVLLDGSNVEENGLQEVSTYGAVDKISPSPDKGIQ
ncbi:hypothetical protein KUTeg_012967 [Tegillarca granosa]|uniref:CSC1-like protein 2 n=1 Tax=Tegillarca granosa TaxID=220873 RepID=A0ABQ9ESB0_TEGGR|nr:hypothetical protein KUTeg_012967 [Tegillarca granosa]